jgi:hypothetical protein
MLNMLFIGVGFLTELVAFLFYNKFKLKFNRLRGTGRMNDLELAHNWKSFFRAAMFTIPVLLYVLKSSFM